MRRCVLMIVLRRTSVGCAVSTGLTVTRDSVSAMRASSSPACRSATTVCSMVPGCGGDPEAR